MIRKYGLNTSILVFMMTLIGSSVLADSDPGTADGKSPPENLRQAGYAVAQLLRNQTEAGLFPYDFDFSNGKSTSMDDISGVNLVRQSCALFALAVYLEHTRDPSTEKAIVRFLQMAARQSVPISKGYVQRTLEFTGLYNRWQLWRPLREPLYKSGLLFSTEGPGKLVTAHQDYERALPGATALTLFAALKYRNITGDARFDTDIRHWKEGLQALMVAGRGVREAPHYLSESPYVNGQTWLAFAAYQAVFPDDPEIHTTLMKFEDYLLQRHRQHPDKLFYSWGMMGLKVRLDSTGDKRYYDFAVAMSEWLFAEERNLAHSGTNSCATIEGVATFANIMTDRKLSQHALTQAANQYLSREMAFNRQLQIDEQFESQDFRHAYSEETARYQGAFILSMEHPLMQVDLTAHCLNALLLTDQ